MILNQICSLKDIKSRQGHNMKHRETKLALPMFFVEFEQEENKKVIYQIKAATVST